MHRRTSTKHFVTDGRLLGEIEEVRQALTLARLVELHDSQGLRDQVPVLERQLVELAQRAAEGATTVVVEGLPGEEFDEIARRHPPTAEQLEKYRTEAKALGYARMPEYNDRTMAPELLAACMTQPDWDEEWYRELSRGQQDQLWHLALSVQVGGADLPFFDAASAMTYGGGERSSMPASEVSPSPNT